MAGTGIVKSIILTSCSPHRSTFLLADDAIGRFAVWGGSADRVGGGRSSQDVSGQQLSYNAAQL